ncbi:hypothetical protein MG5_04082 [Candida albicans P57072]|uniref:Uncharacterized protein n=1 Tax=Candida albicans (strain WO-1) TaxID=294748 RepID=C4YR12_CANAW|nr:conserved hypothetical protein [Candida albicans WO-1]KGR06280.1 hypothetical protein MG5_04082 [Candida albicans P57072]KHC59726.1 hypothetical protein MGE_04054 [Candida albicans P75010]
MESSTNYPMVSMNTPIKKIRDLTLNSPSSGHQLDLHLHDTSTFYSNSIYPSLDDIQTSPTAATMLQKGYSQKITNNVLSELNSRAQQLLGSPPPISRSNNYSNGDSSSNKVMNRRNKRYSTIHMNKFTQMDSINQHYSVHMKTPSPQKSESPSSGEMEESATKRRRTLNGSDQIVAVPVIQKETTVENDSSPNRKISPSKGSRDLNSILRRKTTETGSPNKENFVKPYPPTNKLRQSSLEMAGVVHTSSPSQHQQQQQQKLADPPCLYKKRSIPQLQKKSSHPTLNRKSSIPTLNKKSSIPSLQRKSSIPSFSGTPSPNMPSMYFAHSPVNSMPPPPPPHGSHLPALNKKPSFTQTNKNTPRLTRVSPSKSIPSSVSSRSVDSRALQNSTNLPTMTKSKSVTIPQPFSLYDKPTVSSSLKSLNKFQKFKDKLS